MAVEGKNVRRREKNVDGSMKVTGRYGNTKDWLNGALGIDVDAGKKALQAMGRTQKAASGAAASGVNAAKTSAKLNTSKAVSGGGVKVGSGKSSNSVRSSVGSKSSSTKSSVKPSGAKSNSTKNYNAKQDTARSGQKTGKTWDANAEMKRRREEAAAKKEQAQIEKYEKAFGRKINKGWR